MLNAIVIDNGTGTIKAGYAGNETPQVTFPSFVGRAKYTKPFPNWGDIEEHILIGSKAVEHRGVVQLNYPLTHGIVESKQDWEAMSKIWEHALEEMDVQNSEQHPVLLTEASNNPNENREKAAQIFFENFGVPGFYIEVQAVLSLYAAAKTTGIVLDSGDGVSCVVPIYEGVGLWHAAQRMNVAGRDVTEYLQLLFQRGGYNFYSSAEMQIVKTIKEQKCFVVPDIQKAEEKKIDEISYELPDGQVIKIHEQRFQAPEILFDPSIIDEEYPGVHEALSKAIKKSDVDIRNGLYSNILLSGGSTMFTGFGERLLKELRQISPSHTKIKIFAPRNRLESTWIGGSILANLAAFKKMWITRESWEEKGKRAIYQKRSF